MPCSEPDRRTVDTTDDARRTMSDEHDHVAVVEAWRSATMELSSDGLLTAFERGFSAMWRRMHTTLGDVTLTAIGDRVLYDATERFPNQRGCRLGVEGLDATDLRSRASSPTFDGEELALFVTFVLTELLTVVGALTADVLSDALHRALLESCCDGKDSGP